MIRDHLQSKSKNYVLYPHLLDYHILRLTEANRLVGTYMQDTELLRTGLIKFENFVGNENLIAAIEEQIQKTPVRDEKAKDSMVRYLGGTPAYAVLEPIWHIITGSFKKDLFDEVSNAFVLHTYLQHLFNKPDDGDDQKVFHSDTFFHCLKFWYFPRAVSKENGAFWYVPNSPILTDGLLEWHKARVEDLKNGCAEDWRGVGHKEGSFRINEAELKELGLTPLPVEVNDDTLIVANVFGFHKRGDTVKPTHRLAVHGSIRISNPLRHSTLNG